MRERIEIRCLRPIVCPRIVRAQVVWLVRVARMNMRMQCWFEIAKNCIVDAQSSCRLEHGLAEASEIAEECVARLRIERIQVRHDWIGQQETITAQYLLLSHDSPPRAQTSDNAGIATSTASLYESMNGGGHRG